MFVKVDDNLSACVSVSRIHAMNVIAFLPHDSKTYTLILIRTIRCEKYLYYWSCMKGGTVDKSVPYVINYIFLIFSDCEGRNSNPISYFPPY